MAYIRFLLKFLTSASQKKVKNGSTMLRKCALESWDLYLPNARWMKSIRQAEPIIYTHIWNAWVSSPITLWIKITSFIYNILQYILYIHHIYTIYFFMYFLYSQYIYCLFSIYSEKIQKIQIFLGNTFFYILHILHIYTKYNFI